MWWSLGPSMSLQRLSFFPFCGWVILHGIYVPHLLNPFLCQWTPRLLPCLGHCESCCHEHWGVCSFCYGGALFLNVTGALPSSHHSTSPLMFSLPLSSSSFVPVSSTTHVFTSIVFQFICVSPINIDRASLQIGPCLQFVISPPPLFFSPLCFLYTAS